VWWICCVTFEEKHYGYSVNTNHTWISTRILCFLFWTRHSTGCDFVLFSIQFDSSPPLLVICIENLRWWWHGHELVLVKVKQCINLYCEMSTATNTFFQTSALTFFSSLYCKLPCWSWKQIGAHLFKETGIRFYLIIKLY